jgi:glycolate oxidase FAD binding subunit
LTWPDSPIGGSLGDGRVAHATDRPETVESLRQVVIERIEQGHVLYPQGGGTALDFGGIPCRPGVAIDTRGLSQVIDYPAADMTITVEAGITMARLRDVLAGHRQRLQIDAPQADRATLGGVYATNTSGPRRFGHGRPRDQIIGVSFVTSDGAVVKGGGRVVKNVAGYDFPKLLTGSLGTLGIITQLTLKVRPIPEADALAWVPLPSFASLHEALERLNTSGTRPVAVEVFNRLAAPLILGASAPLGDNACVLVVGFEDNAASVSWQVDRLRTEVGRNDVEVVQGTNAAPLWEALTEFPAAEVGPLSFVANIPPSKVAGFVGALGSDDWAVQAHAGNGIVRGHALPAIAWPEIEREINRGRHEAVRLGGNLVLARCPTEAKERLRVWGEPRPDWALAERVKRALDPVGAMNPGRFVGTI